MPFIFVLINSTLPCSIFLDLGKLWHLDNCILHREAADEVPDSSDPSGLLILSVSARSRSHNIACAISMVRVK